MGATLRSIYFSIRKKLGDNGESHPESIARHLMKQSLGASDIDFIIRSEEAVSSEKEKQVLVCLDRYLGGEPLGRIFGETEFWGLPFKVTPDVLDPRQDTETIVAAAVNRFKGAPPRKILDMGTGSGCLIVALLSVWRDAAGVAVDISEKALAVAASNARLNGVAERITFLQSNWAERVEGSFDLIVSNPPYISNQEMESLPPEVKNHDPILALKAGVDGLDCYRNIVKEIKTLLKAGGGAFLETGFSQAGDVARLVEDTGLSVVQIHSDMAGIPRVVEISSGEK